MLVGAVEVTKALGLRIGEEILHPALSDLLLGVLPESDIEKVSVVAHEGVPNSVGDQEKGFELLGKHVQPGNRIPDFP